MSITATQTASNDAREAYYGRVDAARGRSAEPAWLTSRRAAAARQLLAEGFPTTRDEEFRFTNVAPVTAKAYPAADVPPARANLDALLEEATVPGLDAHEIVFVNGRFAPELSSIDGIPAGVRLTSLASSIGADPALVESLWDLTIKFPMQGFTALNTALAARRRHPRRRSRGRGRAADSPAVPVERPGAVRGQRPQPDPRRAPRAGAHRRSRTPARRARSTSRTRSPSCPAPTNRASSHCRVQRESTAAHHISGTHLHLGRGGGVRLGEPVARRRHRPQRRRRGARRRGHQLHAERPVSRRRRSPRRQPHHDRSRQAALREPRALQGHPRRPRPRRVQRQDLRPRGRAEDRRQADQQDPAAVRRRDHRHQAAARDLRRRREVHARRDDRPARRGRRCST